VEHGDLLPRLLLLVAFAAVGVAIFERLRLPAVVGFLLTGAIVGPGGLGLVTEAAEVRELAELGVVFLLFEISLELPVDRLRRMWREAFVAGALQVGLTLAAVAAGASWLGLSLEAALVVGALVALSSTALVIEQLSAGGALDAPHGQLCVGILLFQDLCIVPFLLAVPLLAAGAASAPWAFAGGLAQALVVAAGFFAAARFVLPWVLDRVARQPSRDLFTLVAFLVVMGSAVLAEQVGLTLAVGAFVAGLVTSTSPWAHQLFTEVLSLRGLLLGIFFTAVGMLFDPLHALAHAPEVGAFIGAAVLLKALVVMGVVLVVLRRGLRLAVVSGLSLAQTGEFSFVLAAAAMGAGLLEPDLQRTFVAGSVVTMVATPFLIGVAPRLATALTAGVDRLAETRAPEAQAAGARGHVVICGYGLAGRTLARVLRAIEVPYVAVEGNAVTVREASAAGEPVVFGDATRRALLERLGLERARLLAVTVSDPFATREVVSVARSFTPDLPILARTRYVGQVDGLYAAGATKVVAEEFEATIDLVGEMLRQFGIPADSIGRFAGELREEGYEPLRGAPGLALDPWLAELLQGVATEWVEVPLGFAPGHDLAGLGVRARTGVNVLAVQRGGVSIPNPDADFELRSGDRLLVFGEAEAVARLKALLGREA